MRSSLRLRAALVAAALGVSMFAAVLPANAAPKAGPNAPTVEVADSDTTTRSTGGGPTTLGWSWSR
jgi:hypothetical protein